MNKVFLSYNNIISSLGFSSEVVVEQIQKEVSGLSLIKDKTYLPQPFYSSLIDNNLLNEAFESLGNPQDYTKLERMMILSLNDVITQSNLSINDRVGLIVSTTKGNVDALDEDNSFPEERAYLSSLANSISNFFGITRTPIVISNACVSGILAVATAKRYIQQGMYDHVLVVGGDLVTEFILSGFNSFQALSDELCKPYDKDRKGINIGEVTASALVTNNIKLLSEDAVAIIGEASCNDANHISGPSRTGEGLFRSIQSALEQSQISAKDIDFISAHGTATLYNDEMEAIAFNRSGLEDVPTHSLKGYFGHTLGASGLLEAIVGVHSLKNDTLYKSLGFDTLGVSKPINLITSTQKTPLRTMLKTASGFGGCNTAVVFKKHAL
ncbi:beta-ketoacyl synthase [Mangrovimonas sp. AS39]|uniref:beta-ketoacyl-[acyl-carrier-protein] synthase family protein n=1 Tax=Mangrovimonas futianensis TaxID=2895523 RepID=UPI001E5A1251|nr:beta-ketoacyl synthase N-terminal-like domain-containing protein [Mangrovimonas futianensis]MCF1190193.1 beta-ketoacyl synthase [Mangrovimonas futianensis]MCF1194056.1 beta-ketoacyl synthase [Mangrovimonas futianensis]